MEPAALLSVMGATAINAAIPGPCLIMIVARTAQGGAWAGLRTSLGIASAQILYVFTVLILLRLSLPFSGQMQTVIRVLGAGILMVLAVRMFLQVAPARIDGPVPHPEPTGELVLGLGLGLSSPFNLVFMFSVLPQFITPETAMDPMILGVVAGIFCATMGPKLVAVWMAHEARHLGQGFVRLFTRCGALALMVFATLSVLSIRL